MHPARNSTTILLVEDDARLGLELRKALRSEGVSVDWVRSGSEAVDALDRGGYDLMILDWMLPDTDGPLLLTRLRQKNPRLPVIMLTARDAVEDRITGLDAGADDYLSKPFALGELLARIRTLLRRAEASMKRTIMLHGMKIDVLGRQVTAMGSPIDLTPREFDILLLLAEYAGETVSRQTLARDIWRQENRFTPLDNVIDVHLANLRRKLRENLGHDPIETVRGVGFLLRAE
jgi:DNA-binding response OmpR family regulator